MPALTNRSMTPLEWGLLLVLSLLWGGSFFFVSIALQDLPPLTVALLRVGLAALALHLAIRAIGTRLPKGREVWTAFFGMGFLNNVVPFVLIIWGQTHVASGIASILNAATPLFTVVLAHLLTDDEKMSFGRLAGVIIGFCGVGVMIGGAALQALGISILAQVAILVAALSYAFAGIFGRRFKALGVSPIATATGQVTASSLMLLPIVIILDQPWALPVPSPTVIAAVASLGLFSTALAYILYFRILSTAGATNLLLVTFLIPVTTVLLGVSMLGETFEDNQALGMILIGAGLAAVDGRTWRLLRQHMQRAAS